MAGRKGRSGRRPGPIGYHSKPIASAGRYLEVLIEAWLAGWPIPIDDGHCLGLTGKPRSVPRQVSRFLAKAAIEKAVQLDAEDAAFRCIKREPMKRPTVEQVLRWTRRRAPAFTLRRKRNPAGDEREAAYREYLLWTTNAWKSASGGATASHAWSVRLPRASSRLARVMVALNDACLRSSARLHSTESCNI